MPTALQLAEGNAVLMEAVRRSRKLLNRRALVGAAASAIPVPGLDWAVDAALLSKLVPAINAEFGLTPQQLDALPAHKREQVEKALAMVGSVLIGKFITRDLVLRMAQKVGMRVSAKQAAKYVRLAGQAMAAIMGYAALRYLGEEHIKDCVRVAQAAQLALPPPQKVPVKKPVKALTGRTPLIGTSMARKERAMDAYLPLDRRASLGAARICRPAFGRSKVTLDSPAVDVMTDLTQVAAVVIDPQAKMELAHSYMMQRGVRMLLALDKDDALAGSITATDILGEKPVSLVREQRAHHSDILVSDVMTPASRLDAFEMRHVSGAQVGHIVSSLQQSRRHHALVVQHDDAGHVEVRGIFSLSQIARQLGVALQLPEAAGSFAEIEAALAG